MNERMPLFGRIIQGLQERYTANRVFRGSDSQYSWSEPVLKHLRERGIKGIPDALREYQKEYRDLNRGERWQYTARMLCFDTYGFLLIAIYGRKLPRDFFMTGI